MGMAVFQNGYIVLWCSYKRRADIVLIKFSQRGRMEIKRFLKYMHTCLVISGKEIPTPFCICFCITGITQMS